MESKSVKMSCNIKREVKVNAIAFRNSNSKRLSKHAYDTLTHKNKEMPQNGC
jgi:hypothetical protein